MKTVVSEKGQITIPKAARKTLGLEPGTELEITCEGGRLVARKNLRSDPLVAWRGRGRLPAGKDTDSYLRQIRDADGD